MHVASTVELWLMGFWAFRRRYVLQAGIRLLRSAPQPNANFASSCGVRGPGWPCAAAIQGAETTMPVFFRTIAIMALAALLMPEGAALAGLGQPTPWQIGLQEFASSVMDEVAWFHSFVLWIITGITVFVLALLLIVIVKFNAKANPTPSRTTHNTLIEVLWTVIPVVILVIIALPSFKLLFLELDVPKPDLTIKATGKQWFWSYSYPDNGNFEFDSLMVQEK